MAHRRSASRYFYLYPIIKVSPAIRSELIRDVREGRPRVLVWDPELPEEIAPMYEKVKAYGRAGVLFTLREAVSADESEEVVPESSE